MALDSFRIADSDKDGRISQQEFIDWYNSPDFKKIHNLLN